ncbi:MAG TPA: cytochrome c [Bryobacteraceae bacterium]|nr:cytochrome c [Bryobacteraceae bacterium]
MKQSAMFTALLGLGLASFFVRAQNHSSTRDGVYTDNQAERGADAYKTSCASCHGAALEGSGAQNPALTGPDFLTNWSGQPLDELFEKIQSSMPADRPGSLSRTATAEIVAYILKANKFPAGKTGLPDDAGALKQIQFDSPKQ